MRRSLPFWERVRRASARWLENRSHLALALLLGLSSVGEIPAQETDRQRPASATLPETNEGLLLSNQITEAIRAGDHRLALELADRLLKLPNELIGSTAMRTYYPVWREAGRLLRQLPADGVAWARQMYDAEVSARLSGARDAGDVPTLRALFRAYPLSELRGEIATELAALLLDSGHAAGAVEVLREWLASDAAASLEARLMLCVALAQVGAIDAARDELRRAQPAPAELAARAAEIDRWIGQLGESATGAPLVPQLHRGGDWSQSLTPTLAPDDDALLEAMDRWRRLPLHSAELADDVLLVRVAGTLIALDAVTLATLWTAEDSTAAALLADGGLDPAERLLHWHYAGAIGAGAGLVLTIEGGSPQFTERMLGTRLPRAGRDSLPRNELVARRVADGQLVWRTGQSTSLFDVEFQDRPLLLDGRILAVVQRGGDCRLIALDPRSGEPVADVEIVGAPTHFDRSGGRCLLAADESSIYVQTGNGVVAALAREDLTWKWAVVYPSTLAQHLGRLWWQPPAPPNEAGVDRPQVRGELLIVAPMDSPDIFAIDRVSGVERWRLPRREYHFLAGCVPGGVIVGGAGLACLHADQPDPRNPRWATVPLAIAGRPLVTDARIFVPTTDGVVVVDAVSGKVIDEERRDAHGQALLPATPIGVGANLLSGPDGLLAIAPRRVVKYPDAERGRAQAQRLASIPQRAPAGRALDAWLDLFANDPAAALARFGDEPAPAELLTHAFVDLAQQAQGEQRAILLEQAAARVPAAQRAQLALLLGDVQREEGRLESAWQAYERLLVGPDAAARVVTSTPELSASAWSLASARLRSLRAQVGDEIAGAWLAGAIARAAQADGPLALVRWHSVAPESPQLAAALAGKRLAPEIAATLPPPADGAAWAASDRAAVLLQRWEQAVSLADLNLAQARAADWHALATAGVALEPDAQERVAAIELAQRKLEQLPRAPFGSQLTRQWKVENAELVMPAAAAPRSAALVRNHERQQVELRRIVSDGLVLRQSLDGLAESPPGARSDTLRAAGSPPAWPMCEWGALAVLPVNGGLAALGLGSERYGGRRLWDVPVADWATLFAEFESRVVAGEQGCFVALRRDRIARLDWLTGGVIWQREISDPPVQSLHLCGERLVLIGQQRQILSLDAATGGDPQRFESAVPPRDAAVASDVLLIRGEEMTRALNPRDFSLVWERSSRPGGVWRAFPADGLLALPAGDSGVEIVSVHDGAAIGAAPLEEWLDVTVLARDGERVFVAGPLRRPTDEELPGVRMAALQLGRAAPLWQLELPTALAVNRTQLLGHPEYVAVLLDPMQGKPSRGNTIYWLQLIDKRAGAALEPLSLLDEYRPGDAVCAPNILLTPTRVVVQVEGTLLAYGQSSLGGAP